MEFFSKNYCYFLCLPHLTAISIILVCLIRLLISHDVDLGHQCIGCHLLLMNILFIPSVIMSLPSLLIYYQISSASMEIYYYMYMYKPT